MLPRWAASAGLRVQQEGPWDGETPTPQVSTLQVPYCDVEFDTGTRVPWTLLRAPEPVCLGLSWSRAHRPAPALLPSSLAGTLLGRARFLQSSKSLGYYLGSNLIGCLFFLNVWQVYYNTIQKQGKAATRVCFSTQFTRFLLHIQWSSLVVCCPPHSHQSSWILTSTTYGWFLETWKEDPITMCFPLFCLPKSSRKINYRAPKSPLMLVQVICVEGFMKTFLFA